MPSLIFSRVLLFIAILAPISILAGPGPPILASKALTSSSSRTQLKSPIKVQPMFNGEKSKMDEISAHLQKTVYRIINGVKSIPTNFLEGERLKKLRKLKGNDAITYSEYKFLEKNSEDLSKIFRMVITIPFSPEFFFYSYIVFPAMATTNPFAWSTMSSGFDADPVDARNRILILEKRRIQTAVSALVALKGE
jgi:hypothetical protein